MSLLPLFEENDPASAGGTAGAQAARVGRARASISVRAPGSTKAGWARSTRRSDTPRGASSRAGNSRPSAWPSTPRHSPRSAATSASTSSPPRITGDGSSTRRPRSLRFGFKVPEEITVADLAGPCPLWFAGRTGQRVVPRCPTVRARLRPAAGALPRPGRHADLRVRHVLRRRPSQRRRVHRAARRIPRGTSRRVSLRGRDPQPGVPRARLLRDAGRP